MRFPFELRIRQVLTAQHSDDLQRSPLIQLTEPLLHLCLLIRLLEQGRVSDSTQKRVLIRYLSRQVISLKWTASLLDRPAILRVFKDYELVTVNYRDGSPSALVPSTIAQSIRDELISDHALSKDWDRTNELSLPSLSGDSVIELMGDLHSMKHRIIDEKQKNTDESMKRRVLGPGLLVWFISAVIRDFRAQSSPAEKIRDESQPVVDLDRMVFEERELLASERALMFGNRLLVTHMRHRQNTVELPLESMRFIRALILDAFGHGSGALYSLEGNDSTDVYSHKALLRLMILYLHRSQESATELTRLSNETISHMIDGVDWVFPDEYHSKLLLCMAYAFTLNVKADSEHDAEFARNKRRLWKCLRFTALSQWLCRPQTKIFELESQSIESFQAWMSFRKDVIDYLTKEPDESDESKIARCVDLFRKDYVLECLIQLHHLRLTIKDTMPNEQLSAQIDYLLALAYHKYGDVRSSNLFVRRVTKNSL